MIDNRTGLSTTIYFRQRLDEETARAARTNNPLSILRIDVTDSPLPSNISRPLFLSNIVRITRAFTRPFDILTFVDPGTFLLLLPQTDHKGAGAVAHRIREQVDSLLPTQSALDHLSLRIIDATTGTVYSITGPAQGTTLNPRASS